MRAKKTEEEMRKSRTGPKKETGGNTACDRAWIAEMIGAGELLEVTKEDRPAGFFDDVIYQWQYHADEANEAFFESFRRTKRRCNGTAYVRDHRGGYVADIEWHRIRRPCLSHPMVGSEVCQTHGGKIPAVKAKAQQILAEASEVVALRLVGLTGTHDEILEQIDHKVRLAAANSVLDRAGIKGTVEVEVTMPGYKKVMADMFGTETPDAD